MTKSKTSAPVPAADQPIVDRYYGMGGVYVIVGGEKFRADEQGNPLPHAEPASDAANNSPAAAAQE